MTQQQTQIKDYLNQKGISFRESNGELITKCLFSDCDNDSREGEGHLYFSIETGQYQCKKCGAEGNLITLQKHFGDKSQPQEKPAKRENFSSNLVEECHANLPERIKQYLLNERGLTKSVIEEFKIGYGQFYGKNWITIPIKDESGEYAFFKLRKDPEDKSKGPKYLVYPSKSKAQIFNREVIKENETLLICEGEFDCLSAFSNGIPMAITSTAGAGTFKDEWIDELRNIKEIYLCFDQDKTGQKEAERLIEKIGQRFKKTKIFQITLPEMENGKDLTDYFLRHKGEVDRLFYKLSKQVAGRKAIDSSKFQAMDSEELTKILGLTVKRDNENKVITFLCMLSAFTEESQFNASFNAPSSSGKSYIPLEISNLFPADDMLKLGDCSPSAFYHEQGEFDKEKNQITVDLSRKIIVFLDQPNNQLLKKMRSLLSHDEKEIQSKIADKNQKGGNRTKTVIIKGFPSVIFCSAGLAIDEQEGTRFLLLSPESSQEKLRAGVHEKVKKDSDRLAYKAVLEENKERALLMERIEAIRNEEIEDVKITEIEAKRLEEIFLDGKEKLKPRHQRDIGRLINIIKALALLNLWFRERDENGILIANNEDIQEALKIWEGISESQEYNLPPYVFQVYKEVIIAAFEEKNTSNYEPKKLGISRQEFFKKHYQIYGRLMPDWQLRQEVLPMLETAGLITQDKDPDNKRSKLIYPATIEEEEEDAEIRS